MDGRRECDGTFLCTNVCLNTESFIARCCIINECMMCTSPENTIISHPTSRRRPKRHSQMQIQRASSSLWRGQPRQRDQLVSAIEAQLTTARDSVRVLTNSGVITLAGDTGNLPLTVTNELDRSVTVQVDLATESSISVDYAAPEPITIEPKGKASLEIPVRVLGTQPVDVQVVLSDKNGELYSDAATLQLRSTAATQIAGVIVGIGGAALIVLVALNLWRRHRTREVSDDGSK